MSEAALDKEFKTKKKLASGGDYGCDCAVFDGDLTNEDGHSKQPMFDDTWWRALGKQHTRPTSERC